jgi:thioredoxin 1
MNKYMKAIVIAALVVAVVAIAALKQSRKAEAAAPVAQTNAGVSGANVSAGETAGAGNVAGKPNVPRAAEKRPKLIDLGADKCIPCKMMAPILEQLKKDYADVFDVEFIDVWKNPDAGRRFGIEMIPTQIFFDADGKERFRHVGFYGREEILGKWKELGVELPKK